MNESLPVGASDYLADPRPGRARQVAVYACRPPRSRRRAPCCFVVHGRNRNGRNYRGSDGPPERHGFLVVVPEFSESRYRTQGIRWRHAAPERHLKPREEVALSMNTRCSTRCRTRSVGVYALFGHSAGADHPSHGDLRLVAARRADRPGQRRQLHDARARRGLLVGLGGVPVSDDELRLALLPPDPGAARRPGRQPRTLCRLHDARRDAPGPPLARLLCRDRRRGLRAPGRAGWSGRSRPPHRPLHGRRRAVQPATSSRPGREAVGAR